MALGFAIAVLPIAGAIAAAWIELSHPGETPMWAVAGALFLVAPGLAAAATERTAFPRALRATIAVALFAVLWSVWLANVPVRTHPGIYVPGSSRLSGAVMAAFEALAWLFATSRAAAWIRKRSGRWSFVIGGFHLAVFSAIAFVLGQSTP
jgi:hypothetical protein